MWPEKAGAELDLEGTCADRGMRQEVAEEVSLKGESLGCPRCGEASGFFLG